MSTIRLFCLASLFTVVSSVALGSDMASPESPAPKRYAPGTIITTEELDAMDAAFDAEALRQRLALKADLAAKIDYITAKTKEADKPDSHGLTLVKYANYIRGTKFNTADPGIVGQLQKEIEEKYNAVNTPPERRRMMSPLSGRNEKLPGQTGAGAPARRTTEGRMGTITFIFLGVSLLSFRYLNKRAEDFEKNECGRFGSKAPSLNHTKLENVAILVACAWGYIIVSLLGSEIPHIRENPELLPWYTEWEVWISFGLLVWTVALSYIIIYRLGKGTGVKEFKKLLDAYGWTAEILKGWNAGGLYSALDHGRSAQDRIPSSPPPLAAGGLPSYHSHLPPP